VWTMYSTDNSDKLAANGVPLRLATANIKWVQGAFVFTEDATNSDWVLNPEWALFAPYIHDVRVYVCPADPPTVAYNGGTYPRIRSYALNNYLGWEGTPVQELPTDGWRAPKHGSELDRPADTFSFLDVNQKSICWPYFGVYMRKESFFNFPSSAHSQRGVVAFTDGHVIRHRWRDERTVKARSDNYHMHDDSSPHNVDIQWLQEHATRRQ
jgi:prepilin-type processing-associated H-X9-DG protein